MTKNSSEGPVSPPPSDWIGLKKERVTQCETDWERKSLTERKWQTQLKRRTECKRDWLSLTEERLTERDRNWLKYRLTRIDRQTEIERETDWKDTCWEKLTDTYTEWEAIEWQTDWLRETDSGTLTERQRSTDREREREGLTERDWQEGKAKSNGKRLEKETALKGDLLR